MTPLVAIRGLHVAYGAGAGRVVALNGIDLAIAAGERVAAIGESGSGKSTLALALAGLLPASAQVRGAPAWPGLARAPRNGSDVGFVFQDPSASLDPLMQVGRQVAEVVSAHLGVRDGEAMARAAELFSRVRLPDPSSMLRAYPHQLSGGQKQRVAIAAAIAANPRLLIADEPTSALDTIVQAEIMALLRAIAEETAMALLMITHDIALAAGIAERLVVLRDGVVVEAGATADLVSRPAERYTRALLDASLSLDAPGVAGSRS